MSVLTVQKLSKAYTERRLLDDISFGIDKHDKIGIIGANGAGKTTLLKIIAGLEQADEGQVIKSNHATIGYLAQDINPSSKKTVLDQVFSGHSEKLALVRDYYEAINGEQQDHKYIVRLTEKMDQNHAWGIESEVKIVLQQLGITDIYQPLDALSGGQKKRVALAAALIDPTDVLILDEPTNHLDNKTIEWLEEYLKNRKGALMMITHDRYFLDRVVNRIFELHQGQLYHYMGNYQTYLEKKAERELLVLAEESKKQNLYRNELAWMRRGAQARSTKQKARIQRFESLEQSLGYVSDVSIDISVAGSRLGKKILEIKDLCKTYPTCRVIEDFSYTAQRHERVGIIGENGVGKSTFIKLLLGLVPPDKGEVQWGETVRVGYFSQEPTDLDPDLRAIDYVRLGGEYVQTAEGDKITASQMMERFLFDKTLQWTPIAKLSGGEKRRLSLLRILMEAPNVLIFDEPTNDLDIQTLTVLEAYLEGFNGVVYIVSHDRYMLDKVVDKLLVFRGNGFITEEIGQYSDYLELEKENVKNTTEKPLSLPVEKKVREKTKFSYQEQKEWETIESDILDLETQIEGIEKMMLDEASDYVRLEKLASDKIALEDALDQKMQRWMVLNDLNEQYQGK